MSGTTVEASASQREQQDNRSANGRYQEGPRCDCCRKAAGHGYSSHSRCEELDFGRVLCAECFERAEDCTTLGQFKALSKERRRAKRNKSDDLVSKNTGK